MTVDAVCYTHCWVARQIAAAEAEASYSSEEAVPPPSYESSHGMSPVDSQVTVEVAGVSVEVLVEVLAEEAPPSEEVQHLFFSGVHRKPYRMRHHPGLYVHISHNKA